MYPTQHHQLFPITIIKDILLVHSFTCITRTRLVGYDEPCDEESVGLQNSAQDPASLEILTSVTGSSGEEVLA
jgi:hypothetical protein